MALEFKNDVSAFISKLKNDAESYRGNRPFETLMEGLSDGTIEFRWHFGGRLLEHSPKMKKPDWIIFRYLISAPFIYVMIFPILLLDITVSVYQAICFPLWKVPKVKRSRYVIINRHRLSFLTGFQKLNAVYCDYANGVFAFTRRVAGESSQFWAPIKHEPDVPNPHAFHIEFTDYNDPAEWAARQTEKNHEEKV